MDAESPLAVPRLTTALSGPLLELESLLLANQARIEAWLRDQWRATPPPFYTSVDLRNAGFKLAPVDTNLFPAGFNNLNPAFRPLCVQAAQAALERACPGARRVLLVPESHTRNRFYFESLATLADIIALAGYEVRIGALNLAADERREVELAAGGKLVLEGLVRHGNRLGIMDFDPCVIILNNDLSAGRPAILEDLAQWVLPPPALGWATRRKTEHFRIYSQVAREFAGLLGIDPWLIDPLFRNCGKVNFMKREGEECLASNVAVLLEEIRAKYAQYGIEREPFIIVKADAGTYGMGVMTVRSPDDVLHLNRNERKKMAATKEGSEVTSVLIQEGVFTFETWGENAAVAEPVVYMIDRYVVGGFYRVHARRGPQENLNAPGMHFEPLAFAEPCNAPDASQGPDACPNRFYAYGVIARLAMLAAAREIARVAPRMQPAAEPVPA
ncbi:MAG TPA: glutamate--cysteine ligase [Gammaproteobacteria bacterium]|nr:glutamate--cysteine ligase [Gammaproteobacteria bacterium]